MVNVNVNVILFHVFRMDAVHMEEHLGKLLYRQPEVLLEPEIA